MSLLESGNVKRTSVGVGGAIAVAREAFEAYDRQVAAIVVQSQYLIQDSARLYEENSRLKALLLDAFVEFVRPYGDEDAVHEYADRLRELGIGVDDA